MESPLSAGPSSIPSRLQTHLKRLVNDLSTDTTLETHPFFKVWVTKNPQIPADKFVEFCSTEKPLKVLAKVVNVVKAWRDAGNVANPARSAEVDRLVTHASLVAVERWLSDDAAVAGAATAGTIDIAMVEAVWSAIVAASWLNCGLRVTLGSHAGPKLKVLNLITDHAELQLGQKTLEQVLDDEIQAYVIRELIPPGETSKGTPDPDYLAALLDEHISDTGAGTLFGLSSPVARQGVDSDLRDRLKSKWGVDVYLFGPGGAAATEQTAARWSTIQKTISLHFHGILGQASEQGTSPTGGQQTMRTKVFISYAHKDDKHRERVVEHLNVLEAEGLIERWDDRLIGAGEDWAEEIDKALLTCKVAVLLISPAFLGSKFVKNVEVPALVERHGQNGMRIVPVLIRDCPWEVVDWLKKLQMRPKDAKPLASTGAKRDSQLKEIALEIAKFCKP